jgi:hypothetical protein
MVKKLSPIGNSYGVIIDRPILSLLGIDPQTPLEMTTERGGIFFRPLNQTDDRKKRVRESIARTARVHREALKELAD